MRLSFVTSSVRARPLVRWTLHSPKGNGGPCSGSRSVEEAFNVAGLPTTWGFPEFKDFVPKEDALIISRTKRAGAVLLGKTNVPLGLGDFQSYNDIYGTTNNPWNGGLQAVLLLLWQPALGHCRSDRISAGRCACRPRIPTMR